MCCICCYSYHDKINFIEVALGEKLGEDAKKYIREKQVKLEAEDKLLAENCCDKNCESTSLGWGLCCCHLLTSPYTCAVQAIQTVADTIFVAGSGLCALTCCCMNPHTVRQFKGRVFNCCCADPCGLTGLFFSLLLCNKPIYTSANGIHLGTRLCWINFAEDDKNKQANAVQVAPPPVMMNAVPQQQVVLPSAPPPAYDAPAMRRDG